MTHRHDASKLPQRGNIGMDQQQSAGAKCPSLRRLGLHDHACLFHEPGEERLELASAFLCIGLAGGERCVYAAAENTAARIMHCLRASGVDVGQALASGALDITTDAAILPLGTLDPAEMFGALESRIEAALVDGYKGLRVVGQAAWALARNPKVEKLAEFEEKLKGLFLDRPAVGIWQYDRARSAPGLLRSFLRVHPFLIVGDEVYRNGLFTPASGPANRGTSQDELQGALDAVLSRARAEDALARHLDQLHRTLEGGAHALWEWDVEGDRVLFDPRWAAMPGIEPSGPPVTLSEWEQVIHPDDLASLWSSARDHIEGRAERLELEYRMRDRSGSWRWVQLRGKAIGREPAGQGTRIAGTATDVTSLRETRERLIAYKELAAAGRFTARIAHEINNPLAWMTTNLGFMKELLQRSGDAGAPAPAGDVSRVLEALRETEEGTSRIREVVEALPKALSTFEKGPAVPSDVRGELLGAVNKARDRIVQRARISLAVPEQLPRVVAHEGTLGKVFLDLLLNAAYGIPEGAPEDNEVRVVAYLRGERLVVEVTDSGVGMSPLAREHMFDLFLASEANKSPEFSAGLFLCRAIIERSGGQIEVESEPARGTTVRVLLPLSKEDVVR